MKRNTTGSMRVLVAAFLAALALTGCGARAGADNPVEDSPGTSTAVPPTETPTSTPSTPSSTTTPSTPAPKPTPKPTPKPRPTASDGTNIRACRDGRCQVLVKAVTTISFSGPYGRGKLKVTKIDKFAYFVISGAYGGGNGRLGPNCAVTFGFGLTSRCGGTKPAPRSADPAGLTIRVPYVGGGRAVIDLSLK